MQISRIIHSLKTTVKQLYGQTTSKVWWWTMGNYQKVFQLEIVCGKTALSSTLIKI